MRPAATTNEKAGQLQHLYILGLMSTANESIRAEGVVQAVCCHHERTDFSFRLISEIFAPPDAVSRFVRLRVAPFANIHSANKPNTLS